LGFGPYLPAVSVLRIVFMGTPGLARASLQALLDEAGFEVVAAVTQPDRPKGRALKLQPSPVKELALLAHVPVLQPERARNEDFLQQLRGLAPELIAVAAFGQILPQAVLDLPRLGCLNVHTSLLPKYRGAGPIQWAIINGETETGVTIMKMDAGLDTGGILSQERTPIAPEDNADTLHDRLAEMGAALLVRTIRACVVGGVQAQPQPAQGISYAPKVKKQDGQIDWNQSAQAILNRVRGLMPWPGAFTHLPAEPQPHLLKIWQAATLSLQGPPGQILHVDKGKLVVGCGQDALQILALQREGGRRLNAQEFLIGHALRPGQQLGQLG
jgi:methionyl-tRNA formyltransferase